MSLHNSTLTIFDLASFRMTFKCESSMLFSHAMSKAVCPSIVKLCGSTPASSNKVTMMESPICAATCSGISKSARTDLLLVVRATPKTLGDSRSVKPCLCRKCCNIDSRQKLTMTLLGREYKLEELRSITMATVDEDHSEINTWC